MLAEVLEKMVYLLSYFIYYIFNNNSMNVLSFNFLGLIL